MGYNCYYGIYYNVLPLSGVTSKWCWSSSICRWWTESRTGDLNYIKYIKDRYIYSTVVDQAMSYNVICFYFYITCIYIYFILLTIYVNAKIEFILMYAFIIVLPLVFKTSITGFKIISFWIYLRHDILWLDIYIMIWKMITLNVSCIR